MNQSPRLWLRCYPEMWLSYLHDNFASSQWVPATGCPITGFYMILSYPDMDYGLLKRASDSARSLGFAVIPGIVWNIGSHIADPTKKWTAWTDSNAWLDRCRAAQPLTTVGLQDPNYRRRLYIDLELYDSSGQEHALWSDYRQCWEASVWVKRLLGPTRIHATQYYEGFCETLAFDRHCGQLDWLEESFWSLPQKEPAAVQADIQQMALTTGMLAQRGRGYMPETIQDIARDYAKPVREALSLGGVQDVFSWISSRAVDADVNQLGTMAWKTRPKEPPQPPDPAAMGQMAFDLDVSKLALGPCVGFPATPGSVSPTFMAAVPAQVIEEYQPIKRKFLKFDGTAGQGFRASMGRQLSADYTLFFVGLPPSWRFSNDGTGWQLGPYRLRATQSPSARWEWGYNFCAADENARHVICCEQYGTGLSKIILDGVEVGSHQGAAIGPDGTMAIGNNDSNTSRPVKMEVERLTTFEGVDRSKSLTLSRAYCEWYGIRWRGAE